MLAMMTAAQFTEWQAFMALEAFDSPDHQRMDWRFARLCRYLAPLKYQRVGGGEFTEKDFMFDLRTPEERRKDDEAYKKAQREIDEMKAEALAAMVPAGSAD